MSKLILFTGLFVSLSAGALEFQSGVPMDIQKQMIQDLDFFYSVSGEAVSELHKNVFGDVSGSDYKKFFESRVSVVGAGTCGSASAVACVWPGVSSGGTHTDNMFITKNYTKLSHPQIARLMVVYHEARHTEDENENWPHIDCPTPYLDENGHDRVSIWTQTPLQGLPGCDETPIGSYGSSVVLLKNIQKYCVNCNEKVKMDAGIYGDDQLERITNAEAKKDLQRDLY